MWKNYVYKKIHLKNTANKGFFENDVNKPSEKVDKFPVNPQVIHSYPQNVDNVT